MITSRAKKYNSKLKGFTLAEALLALVVIGIASAGVLIPYSAGASVQAEGFHRTLGAKLASDLIEQIVYIPFDQIISTYDGYTEPQGQVKNAYGIVFTDSNYANFSRNASCAYVYMPQESGSESPIYIFVTVEVHYNGKLIASVNRLVSR
jgi:prepilin-type N-terminal cleavage/methylation domain-containing protein